MTSEPQIATFYSYKGGTGRTMTLANVAWILASNGKQVLAVDWDLEAPGLHRYFHPFLLDKECRSSPGVIDMVWDVSVSAMKPKKPDSDPNWYRQYSDVLKYAVSLQWTFPNGGRLDLLPAGRQGGAYAVRVNSFSWKNFYERIGGGGFLKQVQESMRNEYQYVLIDSRTGVSDTSGICTVELPDTLVVCFTLNTQSIEGSAAVTQSVINERQRRGDQPLRIFPVPMRLEDGEKKKLDAGLDYARERFEPFASVPPSEFDTYWGAVAVPYKRFYAYEEVLAPFADRARQTQALLPTAEKLTSYLTADAVTAVAPITEAERRRWLAEFERGSGDEPPLEQRGSGDEPPLEQGLAALQAGDLDLAKQLLLRAVDEAEASGDQELLASARHQLSAVARSQGDLQSAEKWFWQAIGQTPKEPSSSRQDVTAQPSDSVADDARRSSPAPGGSGGPDRYRVCELFAAGRDGRGSASGYRLGGRLVLTAWHVIAPAVAEPGGRVLVRPVGTSDWLPSRVEWHDAEADAALVGIEDEGWRPSAGESVLRWGELAGSDPVACMAVGFPWASARPDRMRDTAHLYGQLAPLGQLRQGRLDLDVASALPSAREGGSPWAGMAGAGVIADSHLVGVITVDPARYQNRLVVVPVSRLLADAGFRDRLATHGVPTESAPVGAAWYLQLAGGQTVSLDPPYRSVSRRLRPALSTLLRPEHGLVPFVGRQNMLSWITGWCQDPGGRPLLLVTGGVGSGKTRLGREACVEMLAVGWDAGLADDQRRDGTATDSLQRPTLVVVDDADLRTGLISGLVDYLRWDDAGPPVRLLLLARATTAWWDRLVRQQDLDDSYKTLDLDRDPLPAADRAEHFRRASTAFAAYSGAGAQPLEPPPATELADPAYAEPLLIHIVALLRTVNAPVTPPPSPGGEAARASGMFADETGQPVRQQLLRALCQRERARWYQLGGQLLFNRDLPLADQVVALATLTAAADQTSATSLLAALPNQAEVTRIGAEALVVWAHRLYSGPSYWNPMQPDLLAEQHLADTAQLPILAAAAAQLAAGQPWEAGLFTQLLAELTRAAPSQPTVRAALNDLLAAALPRIVELAVTADHAGLADLTSVALQLAPQPGQAAALADQMPEHSVGLAALAATLTCQQATQYRAGPAGEDRDAASRLADSLNNLSIRLADLGGREEALATAEEATGLHRELAAAGPDAFRPGLAMSLNNLSNQLGGLGRREEALATAEEATGLYRELAAAGPDAFRPGLAMSLNNLSNQLGGLGRREEALATAEEATGLYRELAAAGPDAFRPGLAMSLNNLSNQLGGLGRREEALATAEEATGLYRELAAAGPDAFRPGLAMSLNNLSNQLGGLGRREEALATAEEATGLYRELAAAGPDAFRPGLAMSLNNLSNQLGGLSRREEALATAEEAVTIRRELAARWPDAYRQDLEQSSQVAAWLEHGQDPSDPSQRSE